MAENLVRTSESRSDLEAVQKFVAALTKGDPQQRQLIATATESFIAGLTAGEALAQKPAEEPA